MKYFQTLLYSFTIWILASILNGILCGVYLAVASQQFAGPATLVVTVVFSFLFSIPAIFFFWLWFVVCIAKNCIGRKLFIQLLRAAFISPVISSFLFYQLLGNDLKLNIYSICFLSIIAAMTAVFLHRSTFLSVFKNANHEETV